MEVSDSTIVGNILDDAEHDVRDTKQDPIADSTRKASESTELKNVVDDIEHDVRDVKEDVVTENISDTFQNEEEKKENEGVDDVDDDDDDDDDDYDEEEYFSDTSLGNKEESEAESKAEKDSEEGEDDAYALLALAKRSIAQAKVAEENVKAEEIKAAEALKDDEDEDTVFDDDIVEENASQVVDSYNDEVTKNDSIKHEIPLSVEIEAEAESHDNIPSKSEEEATELGKESGLNNSDDVKTPTATLNDVPDDQPKKRREENAELWALLQASKRRLSLAQHHLKPETKRSSNLDSKKDPDSDDEESDNPEASGENKSPKKIILEENENDSDHDLTQKQRKSLDSRKSRDRTSSSLPNSLELDAESEKERRRQENAELWELLVQSKRRLEIVSPSADASSTGVTSESATTPKNIDLAQEKKNYLDDYVLPNDLEEENMGNGQDIDDGDKYDGEDEDEAAIRLSAKELLIAMATAEEAAMSGKESHKTSVLPREELKRDLDTFAFIKSKCSISGPKSKENVSSSSSANTPTNKSSSMAPKWKSMPKHESVINSFIASIKGFRSKAQKATKSVSSSPYSSSKFSSPKFSSTKFSSTKFPSSSSMSSKMSSASITESSSSMMEKLKKSMKEFNDTVNNIDSKNNANLRSSTVVSPPVKSKKWQDRAAVVAEKHKK
jgi:hypothetical protein